MSATERLVIGCMTGTSLDGLDVAAVRVHGQGLAVRAEFVGGANRPLGEIGQRLRSLAEQEPMSAGAIVRLSREFAILHADAVRGLLDDVNPRLGQPGHAALIAVHGQTVFHAPPVSWQMFNGPVLAAELGVPVVYDLRAADLSAGGQGAPITPLADWVLFRSERPTAVVNLGGFCNVTLLPASALDAEPRQEVVGVEGFDVCACNHLLDHIARELLGRAYDKGGGAAMAGTVHAPAREELESLLRVQARAGRSLGTGDETGTWIGRWRGRVSGPDLSATACGAIASVIADRIGSGRRVLAAGGGAHNEALARAIGQRCGGSLETTEACGVPIQYREAAAMAVLGALCADGVPITLARVTGVREPAPVAGVWAGARVVP